MDITQALKDAENALRDFIAVVLQKSLGIDWVEKCGVSEDRLNKWRERKHAEQKRQESGVVEERLLYYADFYDLKTILKKNWSGEFSVAFGDWKSMDAWLTELERYRDPDAHRRELLPHQKNLVIGISGEIRNRLVRYRSKQETLEDYYPRIESARDCFGNIWTPGNLKDYITQTLLRAGDDVDFVITASDPQDAELQFGIVINSVYPVDWQTSNTFSIRVAEEHGRKLEVALFIKSPRQHHHNSFCDDMLKFTYNILPPKE